LTKGQKTKLNKLVREFIILRDQCCLKCGKSDRLHASHIYPKGLYPKMQFDVENVKVLCHKHHLYWWHRHPIEADEWIKKTLDKGRLRRLKKKANTINKTPLDYAQLSEELKKKIDELR
tara:strand:- start:80 stop:436 length:357 start_codon:yes stop_codon:yes gene_type:complete